MGVGNGCSARPRASPRPQPSLRPHQKPRKICGRKMGAGVRVGRVVHVRRRSTRGEGSLRAKVRFRARRFSRAPSSRAPDFARAEGRGAPHRAGRGAPQGLHMRAVNVQGVRVCARARVRVRARACACACVRACVRTCVRARVRLCARGCPPSRCAPARRAHSSPPRPRPRPCVRARIRGRERGREGEGGMPRGKPPSWRERGGRVEGG